MPLSRRSFIRAGTAGSVGLFLGSRYASRPRALASIPGGTLAPGVVQRFATPLLVPPAMPKALEAADHDLYRIAVRQLRQQILPAPWPRTPVWGFGAAGQAATFNAPSLSIEATVNRPVRVEWINQLVGADNRFLPHLLPVDQTLHWANPPGGIMHRDHRGHDQAPYRGPVPFVVHVHGAHTHDHSDGHAEAWYLPAAADIPTGYATEGSRYDRMRSRSPWGTQWAPGTAVFEYPNDQPATTLWYHDHVLGMTRVNVYAGPAGFYLLRGGPFDLAVGVLPAGPHEIPLAIQDRSFNADGSLFYPDARAFFEGVPRGLLKIPFMPEPACGGASDVSPIWNPEFFGNMMMVNGRTWPYLDVERRRYRFRVLNGCNSRFVILAFDTPDVAFWQIGAEGGFLPEPVLRNRVLLAPAERADVIVDFSAVTAGTRLVLRNLGPDEPFSGGEPDQDFDRADPDSTGLVMQFRVSDRTGADTTVPPDRLVLSAPPPLPAATVERHLSLNELESATVAVVTRGSANKVVEARCGDPDAEPFGPVAAMLGTVSIGGAGEPLAWDAPPTERPVAGATEVWRLHNFTEDAHPMHIHLVGFEVVERVNLDTGVARPPEAWETGLKDTVIAFPGEATAVKATFDLPGQYVWHCHIVEHEDNEMMRPFEVVEPPT